MKLQRRTLTLYILVISLPFLISFGLLTYRTNQTIKNNNLEYMGQLCEQINQNLNQTMATIERLAAINFSDQRIQEILTEPQVYSTSEYLENYRRIDSVLRYSTLISPQVLGITLVSLHGDTYSNIRTIEENLADLETFIQRVQDKNGESYISNVYTGFVNGRQEEELITLTRVLLNPSDYRENGYICIDLDYKTIEENFDKTLEEESIQNLLILQGNQMIYQSGLNEIYFDQDGSEYIVEKINTQWSNSGINHIEFEYEDNLISLVGVENPTTGFKIILFLPRYSMQSHVVDNLEFVMWTFVLILFVTILTGYFLSAKLTKPVNQLHHAMKRLEKDGEFSVIEKDVKNDDEINMLIDSFNSMSIQLEDSIKKEYRILENNKRIEIKMLQFQINPHFLYNTLNMISSIASLYEVPEITDATTALSDMFRYNVKGKNIVTLKEELLQVENYLCIQRLRFPNRIQYQFSVDERMQNYEILKFLLQPLVENAIYHGIEPRSGQGKIKISAYDLNDTDFIIMIEDDGIGMSQEEINRMHQDLEYETMHDIVDDDLNRLGVKNVHYRIKKYYGQQYGLTMKVRQPQGLIVELRLPRSIEKEAKT